MSCIVYNGPGPNGSPTLLPSTFALPEEDKVSDHVFLLRPQHAHVPPYNLPFLCSLDLPLTTPPCLPKLAG